MSDYVKPSEKDIDAAKELVILIKPPQITYTTAMHCAADAIAKAREEGAKDETVFMRKYAANTEQEAEDCCKHTDILTKAIQRAIISLEVAYFREAENWLVGALEECGLPLRENTDEQEYEEASRREST